MKKIMIAGTLPENRKILAAALNTHGFQTKEVSSCKELVDNLIPDDIMIVILHQTLQDMNAFDVVETVIRENPYFSQIPFLLYTSDNNPSFFRKCIEKGFKGILQKPFNRKAMFNTIKNLLIDEKIMTKEMFSEMDQPEDINEQEKLNFLKTIIYKNDNVISPEFSSDVNTGYFYPAVTSFFGLEPGEAYDILRSFSKDNIMSGKLFDKVNLCPRCSFHNLNYREICPKCSSLNINLEEVFHHFACGYVGPASDFCEHGFYDLICPKCSKKLRHIGLDYEKPTDTFVCQDCEYIFTEPSVDFKCFNCGYVGDSDKAVETRIYSFSPTAKARKIVEHGSFSVFEIDETLMIEGRKFYNFEFFMYMFKRELLEAANNNGELSFVMLGIKDMPDSMADELLNFISAETDSLGICSLSEEKHILILLTGKNAEKAEKFCKKLLSEVDIKLQGPSESAPLFSILLRKIQPEKNNNPLEIFNKSHEYFDNKAPETPNKVLIYNDENK